MRKAALVLTATLVACMVAATPAQADETAQSKGLIIKVVPVPSKCSRPDIGPGGMTPADIVRQCLKPRPGQKWAVQYGIMYREYVKSFIPEFEAMGARLDATFPGTAPKLTFGVYQQS